MVTRELPPPAHLQDLELPHQATGLVLLPDSLSIKDGLAVAGFRDATQEIRVAALREGVETAVFLPPGAIAGGFAERHETWVLPLILGVPTSVAATLIAKVIQNWIDARRSSRRPVPTLRYRELHESSDGQRRIVELEGPADAMAEVIRSRGASDAGDLDLPDP